jgi:hypothetical protein
MKDGEKIVRKIGIDLSITRVSRSVFTYEAVFDTGGDPIVTGEVRFADDVLVGEVNDPDELIGIVQDEFKSVVRHAIDFFNESEDDAT